MPTPAPLADEESTRRAAGEGLPDLLSAADAAFERAAAAPGGLEERWYRITGQPVRMRIAGARLADRLAPAFAHLVIEGPPEDGSAPAPALTIDLWDAAATGVEPPPAPEEEPLTRWSYGARTELAYSGGRLRVYERRGSRGFYDRDARRIVFCEESAHAVRLLECSQPVIEPIGLWFHDRGGTRIHAAAVAIGEDGPGALLVGEGGAGKSTSALACVEGGLAHLGDDFEGVERDPLAAGFLVHSFFGSVRADAGTLARLPGLAPGATAPIHLDDDKSLIELARLRPEAMARRARLAAILVPRVRGEGPARLAPIPRAAALRVVIRNSLLLYGLQGGDDWAARLGRIAGVVQVPCFALDVGADVREIPDAVREALGRGAVAAAGGPGGR